VAGVECRAGEYVARRHVTASRDPRYVHGDDIAESDAKRTSTPCAEPGNGLLQAPVAMETER
jgi:hypothetical protein